MKKIAFIVNSTISRLDHRIRQIEQTFNGLDFKIFKSEYKGHISVLAEIAVKNGFENIISVGGDGSANECLNGMIKAFQMSPKMSQPENYHWEALRNITLGILPFGTGNDFVKSLRENWNIKNLLESIKANNTSIIDIGHASFISKNHQDTTRFFLNITDLGMGGTIVRHMENKNSFLSGNILYSYAILKGFLNYKKTEMKCYNEEFCQEGKFISFVVANGKYFGSGLGIAPQAILDDGLLDIVILKNISIADYILNLGKLRSCKMISHPEVSYHRCQSISILPVVSENMAIDMDGDFVGYAPVRLTVLHKKLRLFI
jgi:diacylglycerol kinase (ATP)